MRYRDPRLYAIGRRAVRHRVITGHRQVGCRQRG
ncbi:hypothetical protein yruck0001_34770, partial [Yersinia ruckeri ATCC 29473]